MIAESNQIQDGKEENMSALSDETKKSEVIDHLLSEARTQISETLPFLLPQETTEVLLVQDFPYEAGYLGKWRDKHFIVLRFPDEEIGTLEMLRSGTHRLTHEMIHQRFAEAVGLDEIYGRNVREFLESDRIKDLSDIEVAREILRLYEQGDHTPSEIIFGLTETFSQLSEKFMGFDIRPIKERLEHDAVYPEQVKKMLIAFDESVTADEIPSLLKELWEKVSSKEFKELLADEYIREEIINDPLVLLN